MPHRNKKAPETRVGAEGEPKRNYLRRSYIRSRKAEVPNPNYLSDEADSSTPMDVNDPSFCPSEEIAVDFEVSVGESEMTLATFKRVIGPIISEFFVSGEVGDFIDTVVELDCPEYNYELVKKVINMSFDRTDRERELVSEFLSDGYSVIFTTSMISKGFLRLFEVIDDIEMDVPGAHDMLSKFLARAVMDEILPPSFITDPITVNIGGDVVVHARAMLSREHAGVFLESCWGPGDGRSVRALKKSVDLLLREYLNSNDINEAMRCVRELNSPHFHHEIVKRAIICILDESAENQDRMLSLLKFLHDNEVLSQGQIVQGFNRVFIALDDLKLDTPAAPAIVQAMMERSVSNGTLPSDYVPPAKEAVISENIFEFASETA